jgi:hypothetical protein
MLAEVNTMNDQKYQQWLNEGQSGGSGGNSTVGNATGSNSSGQVAAPDI